MIVNLIIGFGSLAKSLLTFVKEGEELFVFSRNINKIKEAYKEFPFIKIADEETLTKAKHVLICLPSSSYQDFFKSYGSLFSVEATFFSFSTALMRTEVQMLSGKDQIIPCKCVGQAKQMQRDHKGMLVVPCGYDRQRDYLRGIFESELDIVEGDEKEVFYVNRQATKATLKMVTALKRELEGKGIDSRIIEHTIEITTRGVIRSYMRSELGGFGKQLLKEIEKEVQDEN